MLGADLGHIELCWLVPACELHTRADQGPIVCSDYGATGANSGASCGYLGHEVLHRSAPVAERLPFQECVLAL